jgi:hypothetical protein
MADDRDDQATQVGHSVVPENGAQETAVHATQPDALHSTDAASEATSAPTPKPPSEEPSPPGSPAEADRMAADEQDPFNEKPHLYAAGAFVGAFVFAQILKRITGGDDD